MALPRQSAPPVVDNRADNRFELTTHGETAVLVYERTSEALTLVHTEVPQSLRGRHLGEALVEAALRTARAAGLRVVPACPFVGAYMRKHPPEPKEH